MWLSSSPTSSADRLKFTFIWITGVHSKLRYLLVRKMQTISSFIFQWMLREIIVSINEFTFFYAPYDLDVGEAHALAYSCICIIMQHYGHSIISSCIQSHRFKAQGDWNSRKWGEDSPRLKTFLLQSSPHRLVLRHPNPRESRDLH